MSDKTDQVREEIRRVMAKQPIVFDSDFLSKEEENVSLPQLNREVESLVSDPKVIAQIQKDYQEVIQEFSGDAQLETFKSRYETLYNALMESYENETRQAKKCKDENQNYSIMITRVQSIQKGVNDDAKAANMMKQEIEHYWANIERAKKREEEILQGIQETKRELEQLNREMEQALIDQDMENKRFLDSLYQEREKLTDVRNQRLQGLTDLRDKSESLNHELKQMEEQNFQYTNEITKLTEQIQSITLETTKEETRKKNLDSQMDAIKKKIDDANNEKTKKSEQIAEHQKKIKGLHDTIKDIIKEKEKIHDAVHTKQQQKFALEKDKESQEESLRVLINHLDQMKEEFTTKKAEEVTLSNTLTKILKENQVFIAKKLQVIEERKTLEQRKEQLEKEVEIHQQALEEKKKIRLKEESDVNKVFKEREKINREIKKSEDEDHEKEDDLVNLDNSLKKLENFVRGYQIEAEKLKRIISLLEKEQEKYGIDASHAHAKYYQTLEELKIKNNLINELQKKNSELEAKLKHQQNLYEAVRSDRNLYSKNLLESQEEISELTKKFTRMTHQVDQLKDELKAKDASVIKQDFDLHKLVEENEKTKQEKKRIKKHIVATEQVVKNQEEQISRLKFIITEAQSEKQRQHKDHEMVVAERDILGTQLIKRNQELAVLYEKIKIAQSNLAKGESSYRDKQHEFAGLKQTLVNLRKEYASTKDQVECTGDLKNEINSLQKDLLNQKTKVRALTDELNIPMNVHRWRKLEAVDQENYERILKIQTLQRRLIAKTEEVNDKDNLIKEKEKLYMELKNILARQPGNEIHEQLANYKENLKTKVAQMKKMLEELKQAQDNVDVYKYEIEKSKQEVMSLKSQYFKHRTEEDRVESMKRLNEIQNQQLQMQLARAGLLDDAGTGAGLGGLGGGLSGSGMMIGSPNRG